MPLVARGISGAPVADIMILQPQHCTSRRGSKLEKSRWDIFFKGYEAVAAFFVLWRVRSFEPSTALYPRVAAANGNVSTLFHL